LHTTSNGVKLFVVSNINTTSRAAIYIRAIKIQRDGEQYGTYYQAVRSYREKGKVKQKVVHLGEHQTAEAALESWPTEIQEMKRTRPKQAEKLQQKIDKLQRMMKGEE
jgi:hypothetical protein